jgi:4'-phosphopantetheinyl transferase
VHRLRFIAAHAGLRSILGRYLEGRSCTEPFAVLAEGKPVLATAPSLRFNLAHSLDLATVVVASDRDVGVDLEAISAEVEIESVAGHFFSPGECGALFALAPAARLEGFFHIWSQKEAYLKGRGDGVVHGLDHFDVIADPRLPEALLADRRNPGAVDRWTLLTLDVAPGFRGALALERTGSAPIVKRFEWP